MIVSDALLAISHPSSIQSYFRRIKKIYQFICQGFAYQFLYSQNNFVSYVLFTNQPAKINFEDIMFHLSPRLRSPFLFSYSKHKSQLCQKPLPLTGKHFAPVSTVFWCPSENHGFGDDILHMHSLQNYSWKQCRFSLSLTVPLIVFSHKSTSLVTFWQSTKVYHTRSGQYSNSISLCEYPPVTTACYIHLTWLDRKLFQAIYRWNTSPSAPKLRRSAKIL